MLHHLDRLCVFLRIPHAELPGAVVAKRPKRAVLLNCKGMRIISRNKAYVVHQLDRGKLFFSLFPKLVQVVCAPAVKLAVF